MAQSRCVTIVGDSNVRNHMNQNNMRDRPLMSGAQVLQCGRLSLLSASLKSVRAESNVCVFSGRTDKRPPEVKPISIRNAVTTTTLARIAIMQLFGKRYQSSNPGLSYTVLGHEPRPLLKIFPAADASDKRVQTYNFIEAVTTLPASFTSDEVAELLKRISPKLHGRLKPLLVVVSDDMIKKRPSSKPSQKAAAKTSTGSSISGSESTTSKSPGSSSRASIKRGATDSVGSAAKK